MVNPIRLRRSFQAVFESLKLSLHRKLVRRATCFEQKSVGRTDLFERGYHEPSAASATCTVRVPIMRHATGYPLSACGRTPSRFGGIDLVPSARYRKVPTVQIGLDLFICRTSEWRPFSFGCTLTHTE
jgi:hypothetical protein